MITEIHALYFVLIAIFYLPITLYSIYVKYIFQSILNSIVRVHKHVIIDYNRIKIPWLLFLTRFIQTIPEHRCRWNSQCDKSSYSLGAFPPTIRSFIKKNNRKTIKSNTFCDTPIWECARSKITRTFVIITAYREHYYNSNWFIYLLQNGNYVFAGWWVWVLISWSYVFVIFAREIQYFKNVKQCLKVVTICSESDEVFQL